MSGAVRLAVVTADPLDEQAIVAAVGDDAAGALVVFRGVIRDHDGGRAVLRLDYTAHPDAEARLGEACARVAGGGVLVAAAHRIGPLGIGDVALVAAVSTAHRAEAFAACSRLVDDIKSSVPIWKRQHRPDGSAEWVGL